MEENYKDKRGISELFDIPIKTLNNDLTEMRRTEFNVIYYDQVINVFI